MKNRGGRPKGKQLATRTDNVIIKPLPVTPVYAATKKSESLIVVNRGGARSSKSYSIAQWIVRQFLTMPGRKILIVRKTLPAVRISVKPLIDFLLKSYGVWNRVVEEKVAMNLWYKDSLIHFGSVDDPEKIRSTEWNVIWMEEATGFTYDDYINLKLRLSSPNATHGKRNQIILSFNPIDENHWIKVKVVDDRTEDCTEIQSSYRNNPFLPEEYIQQIEKLEEQNRNYYRIFGLGEWGKLDSLIYENWEEIPEIFDGTKVYGLDFGYNAPTALIECTFKSEEDVGLRQRLYARGLTNSQLISALDRIVPMVQRRKHVIYADAAEPQRIEEINKAFTGPRKLHCVAANKSVADGIDTVKRFNLYIYEGSDNLLKEIKGYSYKMTKNGDLLDEPIDFNNHAMDATRYAIHTHVYGKGKHDYRITML